MDLTPYLESLRRDLAATAAAGGADIERAAGVLVGALDAATRLALMEALSDAAAEITTKLETATVDVRLRGREAEMVVTEVAFPPMPPAPPPLPVPPPLPGAPPVPPPPPESADLARITLRLPESLKEAVERAATAEGISVNAWLVKAIALSVEGPTRLGHPITGRATFGRRMTGYAQA
jgi:HicB family